MTPDAHNLSTRRFTAGALSPTLPPTSAKLARASSRSTARICWSIPSSATTSDPPVVGYRHPRTVARHPHPTGFDEPDDALPVPAERLEDFEHAGVVGAGAAGEDEPDHARQVVVADRDRVGRGVAALDDLGRRPLADPGQAPESPHSCLD